MSMRNRIYLINFAEKIEGFKRELLPFDIQYHDQIEEFVLCLASAIFVYGATEPQKNQEYNFFQKIHFISDNQLLALFKAPHVYLEKVVGMKRLVNPRQFEIIPGSVVRSKVDTRLGPGIVKEVSYDNALVSFPKASDLYPEKELVCHPSTLRVVTHIKEVAT